LAFAFKIKSVKEVDLESNAVLGLFKYNNYFNVKMEQFKNV
jgi:hypothetical protein